MARLRGEGILPALFRFAFATCSSTACWRPFSVVGSLALATLINCQW